MQFRKHKSSGIPKIINGQGWHHPNELYAGVDQITNRKPVGHLLRQRRGVMMTKPSGPGKVSAGESERE